jgi:shikimate dehydrogenase
VKLVLLGHPVAHSLSPAMMTAALRSAGIEGTYEARDVPPPLGAKTLDALLDEDVRGASVTVPHKEAALSLASDSSAAARAIGAANVLVSVGRGWHAENTDGPGFLEWIGAIDAARARVHDAVVLGAGGSARAVIWALLEAGAARVRVVNRTRARAAALERAFSGRAIVADPGEISEGALLVHCTSLGLRAGDPLPLPEESIARVGCVLDLVYPDTELVRVARGRGVPAEDGVGLLVAQGALAFEAWTGREADRRAMHDAARGEALRRRDASRAANP